MTTRKQLATEQDVSDFRDLVQTLLGETLEIKAENKYYSNEGEALTYEQSANECIEGFSETILSFMYCMIVGHDFGENGTDQMCGRCNCQNPEDES